jgi:phytoene/squalene synthetase
MEKFGVSEKQFELSENNTNFEQLVGFQVKRAEKLFETGSELIGRLPENLKRQIRMTVFGGRAVLKKIEKMNFDLLNGRPVLTKIDYLKIFLKTFF